LIVARPSEINKVAATAGTKTVTTPAAIVMSFDSRGCRKGKKWTTSGAGASASPIVAVTEDYH
jgi:hypothetical protein